MGIGLLTTAGTTILSVLLGRFAIGAATALDTPVTSSGTALEVLLATAVTATGALVAAWYALSGCVGTCCTVARIVGHTWRSGEQLLRRRGAPGVARLVGAGTGAVLTAGLVLAPAQAEPPAPTPEPAIAEDLTWASGAAQGTEQGGTEQGTEPASTAQGTEQGGAEQPESSASASAEASSASSTSPAPTASTEEMSAEESRTTESPASGARPSQATAEEYVVQPGDTLWAIAAAQLGSEASAARIATAWPAWYETNRAAIGPDPDLILPGTVLHEPD